MAAALESFLAPASIAVIGASPEATKLRGRLIELLVKNGYPGDLYPVNPAHTEIRGFRCYVSIRDVPTSVDLAIIVVPSEKVVAVVQECVEAGARNALIMSSGFAEAGPEHAKAQKRIGEIARRSGMRVCGPSAEGFHNEVGRVSATFSPAVDTDSITAIDAATRRCGVIAQSGGIGFSLYHMGRSVGLRFTHVVSVGNEVDLTAADFFDFMVDDPATSIVILFLETIRDPVRFIAAAERAAVARKPVVVIKVGRSAAGSRATESHTGSMAGWDAAYDAFFQQFGMIAVDDPARAILIAGAFATCPIPKGRRAAVVTVSGGGGAVVADALSAVGMELPELQPATQATIRTMIPFYGSAHNPVDVTGQAARTEAPLRIIELLASGDEVDMVVAVTTMSSVHRSPVDSVGLRRVVCAQKLPVLFYTYTVASQFARESLAAANTLTYQNSADVAAAVRALTDFAAFRPLPRRAAADTALPAISSSWIGPLAEYQVKDVLARYGIPVAESRLVCSASDLEQTAQSLRFPLAVKIQSPDIPHKTEAGGVRLNVGSMDDLRVAYNGVLDAARRHAPEARIAGVLLEKMVPRGVEIVIGVIRDPTFGPLMTVGAGGIATELYRDVARRLAPVTEEEAGEMLRQLRIYPLLTGYRGSDPCDIGSLTRLISQVSALLPRIASPIVELELNPVIVHESGNGCTVADALIVGDVHA